MQQIFTEFCTNFSTCSELILHMLMVFFIGGPKVALLNMDIPRYIIIGAVFLILWIISYIISKKYIEKGFVRRGWIFGVRGFWIATFVFYKTGFPIPARDLPPCSFCGSDYPPYSALVPTIANIFIRQFIGQSIAYFFKLQAKNRTLTILTIITIWLILWGFGVLALLFD